MTPPLRAGVAGARPGPLGFAVGSGVQHLQELYLPSHVPNPEGFLLMTSNKSALVRGSSR